MCVLCESGGSTGVGELGVLVLSITKRGGGMQESARVSGAGAQVI